MNYTARVFRKGKDALIRNSIKVEHTSFHERAHFYQVCRADFAVVSVKLIYFGLKLQRL